MDAKCPRDDYNPSRRGLPKRGVAPSFRPIRGPPFSRASRQDAVVAQLVRAPVCGTGGRWFEPTQLYQQNQSFIRIRSLLPSHPKYGATRGRIKFMQSAKVYFHFIDANASRAPRCSVQAGSWPGMTSDLERNVELSAICECAVSNTTRSGHRWSERMRKLTLSPGGIEEWA